MHVGLTYHHWSGEISIDFRLTYKDEEAFGFGIGSTPELAKENMKGWFTKDSEVHGKRYKINNSEPYICLIKKKVDGSQIITREPINIHNAFKDLAPAPAESITVTSYDW